MLSPAKQMRQIYRTRTEIIVDAIFLNRLVAYGMEMAEAAALRLRLPRMPCAARRLQSGGPRNWLRPTPQPERSLADGGFNTDGVREKK